MDHVRFAVEPAPDESGGGFQVLVYVNDVEMTHAGAGLGMDPYDVLIPDNKFLPVPGGRTFGIARCNCGVYGCGEVGQGLSHELRRCWASAANACSWRTQLPASRTKSPS